MKDSYNLTLESIRELRSDIQNELDDLKIDKSRSIGAAMLSEEILLIYRDAVGDAVNVAVENKKKGGEFFLTLRIRSDELNPNDVQRLVSSVT